MSYQTEFPDFTLDVEIPYGFIDESYRNDTMPRFSRTISGCRTITLWVDYADKALSEFKEERFLAELLDWNGEYIASVLSNEWDNILAFVHQVELGEIR